MENQIIYSGNFQIWTPRGNRKVVYSPRGLDVLENGVFGYLIFDDKLRGNPASDSMLSGWITRFANSRADFVDVSSDGPIKNAKYNLVVVPGERKILHDGCVRDFRAKGLQAISQLGRKGYSIREDDIVSPKMTRALLSMSLRR